MRDPVPLPLAPLADPAPLPPDWFAIWRPPLTYEAWLAFYGQPAPQAAALAVALPVTTPEPSAAPALFLALAALTLFRCRRHV